ncbi:hypothetical protein ABZW30_08250 [Kitasatospora sp. NPDC004669]|uniref:hypothetical protein n=1 Tax=Kitasatospora sp. NPDC004669 TaxID=3154555 RepID=UPI00339DE16C
MVLDQADQNLFLQARQAVAALRRRSVKVSADPAFDYTAAAQPTAPSPSALAAGPDAVVVTAAPAQHRHDVAIGLHPRLGIVATVPTELPFAVSMLHKAGFTHAEGGMYTLERGPQSGARATDAVREMRRNGLRVASDLRFEPLTEPYRSTDPFATKLIAALDRTPAAPEATPGEGQALDPFETRLFPVAERSADPRAVPKAEPDQALDPFGTRLIPAAQREVRPAVDQPTLAEQRADALVHDRLAMMTEVSARLRGIDRQLRTDPAAIDPTRVEAVISQAETTLSMSGMELAGVAARAPRPTAAPASPRARAALARSSRVQTTATLGATDAAATAARPQAVDPRKAYANYR